MNKHPNWEGQVFVVRVDNPTGEIERYFDFHVNRFDDEVKDEDIERRLQQHISDVHYHRKHQFPGCQFSGEVMNEKDWHNKDMTYKEYWRAKNQPKSKFDPPSELDETIPF